MARPIFKKITAVGGDYVVDCSGEGEQLVGSPRFIFPVASYAAGVALSTRSAAILVPFRHRVKSFDAWASAITAVAAGVDPAIDLYRHLPKPAAPSVALVAAAGLVTTGTHGYAICNVTAAGTSIPSEVVYVTTDTASTGQVTVTFAAGPSGTTSRKIYRTAANASTLILLATIANNTTLTYTDNLADGSLSGAVPVVDTSGVTVLSGTVKLSATDRTKADQHLQGTLADGIEALEWDACLYSLRVLTGASTGAITNLAAAMRVERMAE